VETDERLNQIKACGFLPQSILSHDLLMFGVKTLFTVFYVILLYYISLVFSAL
jgi:hypothetical protein